MPDQPEWTIPPKPATKPTAANRKYTEHANLMAAIGGAFVRATHRHPNFLLVDAIVTGISGWLAEHDAATIRQAKAEALRDASNEFFARLPDGTGNGRAYNSWRVADMLRDRADRIAAGGES